MVTVVRLLFVAVDREQVKERRVAAGHEEASGR
jgi:hypothetical protein